MCRSFRIPPSDKVLLLRKRLRLAVSVNMCQSRSAISRVMSPKISAEAAKGARADPGRLERLINTLAAMAPDIFDVAVTTLTNPFAGIGLVLKKIGERAKLEAKPGS